MGFLDRIGFARLKEGLTRTRETIAGTMARILAAGAKLDERSLEELEEALIAADVGAETAGRVMEAVRLKCREAGALSPEGLRGLLQEEIRSQFPPGSGGGVADPLSVGPVRPHVTMVVGVNGVGKTTTIGKLARLHAAEGRRVMIAAADTFRAAANEQIEIWAARAGAEVIRQGPGADPAAVAFDALKAASARGADVVIVDTAGRLHTKVNLMEELKKIGRVMGRINPAFPQEVLLVVDASTGQNGLQQARQFAGAVGVTGLVITKLDGTAKGGIALAIARELSIPVKFVGVGERLEDLQGFDPEAFAAALFES
ncbi:MAG: signal recognition particle-docking protein FtsY [Bacteroidota bacterium]